VARARRDPVEIAGPARHDTWSAGASTSPLGAMAHALSDSERDYRCRDHRDGVGHSRKRASPQALRARPVAEAQGPAVRSFPRSYTGMRRRESDVESSRSSASSEVTLQWLKQQNA